MAQYNDSERQAGTLILSQLKMFNEAAILFEQYISPAFWKGFDQCLDRFIRTSNWAGDSNYETQDYSWLAPHHWIIKEDNCKYWFENYSSVDKENDYSLALITGSGMEQGEFGFQFRLNVEWFGGSRRINTYASNIDDKYRKQLIALGFNDQGKGRFFIPVTLNVHNLAECWQEHGQFPEDHEIFTPLRNVLDNLLKSLPIFDDIFSSLPEVQV